MKFSHALIENHSVIEKDLENNTITQRHIEYIKRFYYNSFLLHLAIDSETESIKRMILFLKRSFPEELL